MALVPLSFPPGLYANGTILQAAGRWWDANLVRFHAGTVRPWGGWAPHIDAGDVLAGKARAMLTWTDNSGARWIAVGTSSHLYIIDRLGSVSDITPAGLTPGLADATIGGGYGGGPYGGGGGAYGASPGDAELISPATVWSLDTFGELLVALNNEDGKLYIWTLDTGSVAEAIAASGSTPTPEASLALVVEDTGHILLLGAGGDGRRVQWCDAEDQQMWDAGLPSEAGSFPLQTGGRLKCGRRTSGGTLLLTDQDAWLATYNGGANPFSFQQVGQGCGAISQGAAVSAGTTLVAWMGTDGFWTFEGTVQGLPCEVADRVFGQIDRDKVSQVSGYHRQQFGEIVWHYASSGGADNDRYVVWNYRENHWATGAIDRTCGADRGAFAYPLAIDSAGMVFRQETGFDYGDLQPFIESGPVQFAADGEAAGERVFTALDLIPDELALGDVQASFHGRLQPTGAESEFGPYSASNPTNVRFTTRHVRLRLTGQAGADWRVGQFKLDIQLGGTR